MLRLSIIQASHASAGQAQEVVLTRTGSHAVTALRNGSGNLAVIVWDVRKEPRHHHEIPRPEAPPPHISTTEWPQGPGVVTALRTAVGTLKVIAWKIAADESIWPAGDADGDPISEVAISSPSGSGRVVTPVRTASGELKVITSYPT